MSRDQDARVRALEAERLTGMPRWNLGPPLTGLDMQIRSAEVKHRLRAELAKDERARTVVADLRRTRRAA